MTDWNKAEKELIGTRITIFDYITGHNVTGIVEFVTMYTEKAAYSIAFTNKEVYDVSIGQMLKILRRYTNYKDSK
jgi:hypothetical protein